MLPRSSRHALSASLSLLAAHSFAAAASAAAMPAAAAHMRRAGVAAFAARAFSSMRSVGGMHRAAAAASSSSSLLARAAVPAASAAASSSARSLHTSSSLFGLEEFFVRQKPGPTGRSWRVRDLREKGWLDLQRLWFVLLKERNMLLTYRHQCRATKEPMEGEHRLRKCRQSMSAIKSVLNERYRAYKERTDAVWVERQARIRRMRLQLRVHAAKRRSPRPPAKGVNPGGLKPWQLSNRQKYAYVQPRAAGTPPPEGTLPAAMTSEVKGHGQAPEDLIAKKVKKTKEYV